MDGVAFRYDPEKGLDYAVPPRPANDAVPVQKEADPLMLGIGAITMGDPALEYVGSIENRRREAPEDTAVLRHLEEIAATGL
ncbi:hypothetical protein HYU09_04505 [Candidatus Woesearchaeota archaeon]|nr:hypothetical protein [Candidatus Woesearchaeota archaeon]